MNFWKSFAYSFLFLSLIVYFVDIFLIKKDLFFFTKNEYEKIHKYEIIFNYSISSKSKYILNVDQPINYYFNNGNHIEIYAWLPHFDLNNGLYSLKSQKDDIKEVHFAAFSINEDVTQPLIRSSNYEIGLNSLNSYVKFGINIHSSNPKTLSLFLSKVDYNLIVYEIKSLKRKYENLVSININFEKIYPRDVELFINFIKNLKKELKKLNLNLFLTIFPPGLLADNLIFNSINDIKLIIDNIDYLVLMFYDYSLNNNYSKKGNSPYSWLKDFLINYNSVIDFSKIIIGLPLYGYKVNKNNQILKSFVQSEIKTLLLGNKTLLQDDEKLIIIQDDTIYFLDETNINNRINICLQYGINQFFFWRLGNDEEMIKKIKSKLR